MNISLRAVTRDNFEALTELALSDQQRDFLASNSFSIAQASFYSHFHPRAIYLHEVPIGFLLYVDLEADLRPGEFAIYRFMVDLAYQGKGYGRRALQLALEEIRAHTPVRRILISYWPNNRKAAAFYASMGFTETGLDDDGEMEAQIVVGASFPTDAARTEPDGEPLAASITSITRVRADEVDTLYRLLQLYYFDASRWSGEDLQDNGTYESDRAGVASYAGDSSDDEGWLIRVDGQLAGLVLVERYDDDGAAVCELADLFILPKYRGRGLAAQAIKQLLAGTQHPWRIAMFRKDTEAQAFWHKMFQRPPFRSVRCAGSDDTFVTYIANEQTAMIGEAGVHPGD